MSINLNEALEVLQNSGIAVEDGSRSLEPIARKNKKAPVDIYLLIKKLESPSPASEQTLPGTSIAPAAAGTPYPDRGWRDPQSHGSSEA